MHFAAQGVIAGAYDVVVAAGVEVMTRTPMGASVVQGMGFPLPARSSSTVTRRRACRPQGIGADMIADEYDLSREDLDEFGALRASSAPRGRDEGRFDNEIIPIAGRDRRPDRDRDERRGHPRRHHRSRRSAS
jgi:acetyl-CoA acyltransferase